MAGTETFHDLLAQPYRIQKRLALNQCFKAIKEEMIAPKALTYVTFGGEDLYDVMDLVGVYSLRGLKLNIVSYEQDLKKAKKSLTCPVASTLSKIESVNVSIVRAAFPTRTERLLPMRETTSFIYFLDYTGTFSSLQSETVSDLLDIGLLLPGDHFLVTSCLSPRIVHQDSFMEDYLPAYTLYWPNLSVDMAFKARNHVELFVSKAFERYEVAIRGTSRKPLGARLLRKFRYKDTRSPMGLWAYRVEQIASKKRGADDRQFDDFPTSFINVEDSAAGIPDLFAQLRKG